METANSRGYRGEHLKSGHQGWDSTFIFSHIFSHLEIRVFSHILTSIFFKISPFLTPIKHQKNDDENIAQLRR